MESEITVLRTNYKPGRTVEELETERLRERLNTTHQERFEILMALNRFERKLKMAKISHAPNTVDEAL